MIIAISIFLIVSLILIFYFILKKTYDWSGEWSSEMNPNEIFKIVVVDPKTVNINGSVFEVHENKISAYGTIGKLEDKKIVWENGNIWHKLDIEAKKILEQKIKLEAQKLEDQKKWLNVWVHPKLGIFYKIELENNKFYMTNSAFPGKEEIIMDGNKVYTSRKDYFAELDGINFKAINGDILIPAVEADYNVPVLYYGVWKEGLQRYFAWPNEWKKNSVQIRAGNEAFDASVNGNNINLLGKTGQLNDMKIKWSDGTIWEKSN